MTEAGHNSVANEQLKSIVDRIVRIEERRKEEKDEINDILAEAASNGYDKSVIRAAAKRCMEDADAKRRREEKESILETYLHALGALSDLPLGQAAIKAATKGTRRELAAVS